MPSWGIPLLGSKTQVSEDRELNEGDLICLKMDKGDIWDESEGYRHPELLIQKIREEFNVEGSFEARFIRITFNNPHTGLPPYYLKYYEVHVEVHAKVIHASPLVISVSVGLIILALAILAIVITVAVWSYYIFEKVGVAGGLGFFAIIAVILVIVFFALAGVRKKGGG